MNLFGLNFRWPLTRTTKIYPPTKPEGGVQLRSVDGQGPYTKYFANYIPRKIDGQFYEFLREAIPIMDAAINRLVSLDGHLDVTGENEALVEEIKEWFYNVPVNDLQRGLQAFHQNLTAEAFEQGFALGEFVTDRKRTDIVQLRVGDSKYIKFARNAASQDRGRTSSGGTSPQSSEGQSGLTIYQKGDNDLDWRPLNAQNLIYFSINNENQNPHGTPLFRSCEFVAKVLATMHNSILNVWERFGDPSFSIIYKTSRKDGGDLTARRNTIAAEFDTAIRAKREGKSADFIRAIDTNSQIDIAVIGADGQVLELEIPARHILEQIVGKSGLPAWMLGIQWSTTQSLSDNEAEILLADVATRQAAKMPYFYNLIRTLLLLRGRTWKKGDWRLEWAQVNLKDVVKQAQARFLDAQAQQMSSNASSGTPTKVTGGGQGKIESGHRPEAMGYRFTPSPIFSQIKEETRPVPWPELDRIEIAYEDRLKTDWASVRDKVLTVLKLASREQEAASGYSSPLTAHSSLKVDIPTGIEPFSFTDEQIAAIMKAMRDFTGTYRPDDPDSPVRWYYGQSYSAGLIQAAKLIGKERPILDIIKNAEIYDELIDTGFQLLKDGATRLIVRQIIPEMEAQMLAGTNPRHVAARLDTIFGAQNSDWERLARTEMTMAAESAKLDEWKEWKVRRVEFFPATDGCPICIALAGEYPIDTCPVPGRDTHPRCRCSIRPAAIET